MSDANVSLMVTTVDGVTEPLEELSDRLGATLGETLHSQVWGSTDVPAAWQRCSGKSDDWAREYWDRLRAQGVTPGIPETWVITDRIYDAAVAIQKAEKRWRIRRMHTMYRRRRR